MEYLIPLTMKYGNLWDGLLLILVGYGLVQYFSFPLSLNF
ncbi:hypothetical protein AM202_02115 [Actinobacillus minor 202]|uniref:Uncharacterized protein n=1 Tax=Actinobacillus minor 202 TaxID=591023 RepID=A0ABP2GSW2_9PAST|nr:hypothetical protein AM202_02115 [Actinobacillus minor 202]